jgi:membrane peptidoglycan carboxypeptidase
LLGLCALGLALLPLVVSYLFYAQEFVSPEERGINQAAGGATILDRNGNVLFQYVDPDAGLRHPVPLDQVSQSMIAATIATEDASFFSNPGVNFKGLARALWENVNPFDGGLMSGSGGSSITQQLAKNVYFTPEERSNRSILRKLKETFYALELTSRYGKEQVLSWYLNEISYGGLYYGVEAASQGYFGKSAKDLTLAEAALLAGIPQSPAAFSPISDPERALERRDQVLDLMAQHESIQTGQNSHYVPALDELAAAKASPLELASASSLPFNAPHFVVSSVEPELESRFGHEALLHEGLVVTTTLDLGLQQAVERILEDSIAEFEATSNTHNGAAVVLDVRTGEVLAMAGSRDFTRDDIEGQNDNLLAPNSPGSAFKPFVYLSLFLKENAGPGSLIQDSPVSVRQPDGSVFSPRNPAGNYQGWTTMRNALGNSLNVPAFKVAQAVGVSDIVSLARQMGITGLDGSYGPAIAIGGVDVKALDLAYAYSVLASGGIMHGQRPAVQHGKGERELDPVNVLEVSTSDGRQLFDSSGVRGEQRIVPQANAFLINSILSDPQARCQTFGCGGLSVPGYHVAVKTGTSEPFDPNGPNAGKIGETWAFGYTPDVVVAVWAGNADNAPITSIYSTTIAFRAMREIMLAYYGGRPATLFVPPEAVTRARLCYTSPIRTCVEDWFAVDALPDQIVEQQPVSPRKEQGQAQGPAGGKSKQGRGRSGRD